MRRAVQLTKAGKQGQNLFHPRSRTGHLSVSCGTAAACASKSISHSHTPHPTRPKAGTWLVPGSYVSRTCLVQGGSPIPLKAAGFGHIGAPRGPRSSSSAYSSARWVSHPGTPCVTGRLQENELRARVTVLTERAPNAQMGFVNQEFSSGLHKGPRTLTPPEATRVVGPPPHELGSCTYNTATDRRTGWGAGNESLTWRQTSSSPPKPSCPADALQRRVEVESASTRQNMLRRRWIQQLQQTRSQSGRSAD